MSTERLIVGIILAVLGTILSFNNKSIAKGAARFYRIIYTEKNLKIMFRALGILLIIGGLAIVFFG